MKKGKFYLRVEGVNLASYVYDTDNLSTIRGGGLTLLELPKKVEEWMKDFSKEKLPIKDIKAISCGASWGLYSFSLSDPGKDLVPAELTRFIRRRLNESHSVNLNKTLTVIDKSGEQATRKIKGRPSLEPVHATVMVEVTEAGKEAYFQEDRERLSALLRWRQMCSPTVAFPSVEKGPVEVENEGKKAKRRVCELDYVRPAALSSEHRINGRIRAVSASCYSRYQYGAWGKSDEWYSEVTGLKDLPLFTHHFHELAGEESDCPDPENSLYGKMAVIYIDGNHFGRLQGKHCKTPKDQEAFDRKLRLEYQARALGSLLEKIRNEPAWINEITLDDDCPFLDCQSGDKIKKIRLETLLWGGDEVIWVVPAWRGWWFLGQYFNLVGGGLGRSPWSFKGQPMTFAAGLIFCHNTAPIYRIKELARRLAEMAKGVSRKKNMVAYQVLESFDMAGPDFESFIRGRCPEGIKIDEMVLDGRDMLDIAGYFQGIKGQIPKRALYRAVQALYSGPEEAERPMDDITAQLDREARHCLDCLSGCFEGEKSMWLHLLELWDYLVMPQGEGGGHV